jgi:hypothetical protein
MLPAQRRVRHEAGGFAQPPVPNKVVMVGFRPTIHDFFGVAAFRSRQEEDMDGRDKRDHDGRVKRES